MDEIDSKKRILDATTELLLQKSSDRIRTREIASKAQVNIATIHYYFSTKEKLVNIALEAMTTQGHDGWIKENLSREVYTKSDLILYLTFLFESTLEYRDFARTRVISILNGKKANTTQMRMYEQLFEIIKDIDQSSNKKTQKMKTNIFYSAIINHACSTRETSQFLQTDLNDKKKLAQYLRNLVNIVIS